VLVELAEFVHFVTRLKLVASTRADASISEEEFRRGSAFAKTLGMAVLTRAAAPRQGHQDVKDSPRPLAAADMVLVRLAYAADQPTPDEVLRRLAAAPASEGSGGRSQPQVLQRVRPSGQRRARNPAARLAERSAPESGEATPNVRLARFEDIVAWLRPNATFSSNSHSKAMSAWCDSSRARSSFRSRGCVPATGADIDAASAGMDRHALDVVISRAEGAPTLRERAAVRERDELTGVAPIRSCAACSNVSRRRNRCRARRSLFSKRSQRRLARRAMKWAMPIRYIRKMISEERI